MNCIQLKYEYARGKSIYNFFSQFKTETLIELQAINLKLPFIFSFITARKKYYPQNSKINIKKYINKQARVKPEADASLFTACCILLMLTVDVEC